MNLSMSKAIQPLTNIDAVNGNILDILNRRDSYILINHFVANYSLKERNNVKTVTIYLNTLRTSVGEDMKKYHRLKRY